MCQTTIRKLFIEETALFAINNLPQVNQKTLEQFVDLVNATGNYGTISHEQYLTKMNLAMKYLVQPCSDSLLILADLLEIPVVFNNNRFYLADKSHINSIVMMRGLSNNGQPLPLV